MPNGKKTHNKVSNNVNMDLAKLKSEHGELHNQIVENAKKEERQRIQSLNQWRQYDPENVDKMIENGEKVSPEFIAKVSAKAKADFMKNSLEGENNGAISPGLENKGKQKEQEINPELFTVNNKLIG